MPLGGCQGNDFSKGEMALNSHFSPSDMVKIQIIRGSKIVNLRVRLTLGYHFLPSVNMTNDLGYDEKVIFQALENHFVPLADR
jgi:hypothetical protein